MKTLFSTSVAAKVIADSAKEQPKKENVAVENTKPVKEKKPRVKKKPEPIVPVKIDPEVKILKFDFDPTNPKMGSIELDWNDAFIVLLKRHGYIGERDEDIVNKWLSDVCRTIAQEEFPSATMENARYVQRKDLGDGKTEFS